MFCHECHQGAVGRCRSCGLAFCSGHGADLCRACSGAIVVPGTRLQRAGEERTFLQCQNARRMPTVYLNDDGPPSCHVCDGLAKSICENCHELYCPEHAGRRGWCVNCTSSSRVGVVVSAGIFAFIAAVFVLAFLLEKLHR